MREALDLVISTLSLGERRIFVVSERKQFKASKANSTFGLLISPRYIIVFEQGERYAFSLPSGRRVDVEDLLSKSSSIKEKLPPI